MSKPYLETNPTDRAREAKEYARLAVPYFQLKRELSRAVPTVLRDHEGREEDSNELRQ